MKIKVTAIQLAEIINIKNFRNELEGGNYTFSGSEFFKQIEQHKFIYLLDYGVVVFANFNTEEEAEWLERIRKHQESPIAMLLKEKYYVNIKEENTYFEVKNNEVILTELDSSAIRIIMLNVAQSVALEYYEIITGKLVSSTKEFILQLENTGKINISKKNLLRYIGQVLNVKNSIVDNLYILDDPNSVWENERLDALNKKMKFNFEILPRFKDVDYRLSIVENNLKIFTEVLNVKESSRLEWIIILLITFEIIMSFIR
ncbi:RMD1 family protein [Flavobacterium oreochromis]|uniref:RMD1 family protein n=1 Tax=Flavobacterium oreochromis TaxID=2906078 RepID=A0ABW8PCG3_9FLAO|nr:RMD1 family protein [Flavobacterium oreochromis]QYS85312.1 RMD1 family protein [Flavobacterium oreochromis]